VLKLLHQRIDHPEYVLDLFNDLERNPQQVQATAEYMYRQTHKVPIQYGTIKDRIQKTIFHRNQVYLIIRKEE
tara:strand:- start:1636 stop:1854 length:219 start_codon:yes stop_codon:yes gene_type:complete